ncbi:ATP-binding protein [Pedobacter sp.]|uniref:ATP-binding protein n=1 Tax=Pedobacter sp. TaxID=1411316 RepID=UPI003D7F93E9
MTQFILQSQYFKEFYFKGPLQKQLRDALSFLKTYIISEQIIKRPNIAEADRFYNFPYDAIEETLSNTVYHKSYELGSPIEVQVWPDKIEILSHPGPIPPVNAEILSTYKRIIAREYRNRRIGDFLKELRLTEGRGTGFPTIYKAMEINGSPLPVFNTDEHTYVLVTLPVHAGVIDQVDDHNGNQVNSLIFNDLNEIVSFSNQDGNQASNQASIEAQVILNEEIHDRVGEMLKILSNKMKRAVLFNRMNLSNQSKNRSRYLDPLVELGWVKMEFPQEKTSPNQTYMITTAGKRILDLINAE